MRKVVASLLLMLLVSVDGCGTSSTPPSDPPKRAEATCAARRITAPPYREGACIQGGQHYIVENGRSAVHLRTLTVALRYFILEASIRDAAPKHGIFLLARMKVSNTTDTPQRFRPGQTFLSFGGGQLAERTDVERLDSASLSGPGRMIDPGKTVTGVVAYDVKPRAVTRIMREGVLYIGGFGPTRRSELGVYRLGDTSSTALSRGHR
jgi:hypothetical protein